MKRSYNTSLTFLDLLFNTLLCFAALFVISFLLINPINDDGKIDVYADFLITASWPEDMTDDIDVYIQDPLGEIVYFKNKEGSLMHLDRDDLGGSNDLIETGFGVVRYSENREIVTIRKSIPGQYIINVHVYSKKTTESVPVEVQIDKITPFSTIFLDTIILMASGEEKTVCGITLDSEGAVVAIDSVQKRLVREISDQPWSTSRWD